MADYLVVSVRGNPNYSQQTIADTLIRIYGKDFFKKLPIVKNSGMLRYLINKLSRGHHAELLLSVSAHSRLVEMNEKLVKKGVTPPLVTAGHEDASDYYAPEISAFLVNKQLPRWFSSDKEAVYVHFIDKNHGPFNDRVIQVGEEPVIFSIIKTLGIPWFLLNAGALSSMVKHCQVTGNEFLSSDWNFLHITADGFSHEDSNELDPDDSDEDDVFIDDDLEEVDY